MATGQKAKDVDGDGIPGRQFYKIPTPTQKSRRLEYGKPTWYYGLPDVAIMHFSAGYSVAGCWDALNKRKLSVHASIERDGTLWKHREWKERAIHAGYGVWRGKQDLNQRAFGVEIINLGSMDGKGDGSNDPIASTYPKWGPPEDELIQGSTYFYRVEGWKDSKGNQRFTRVLTKTPCSRFKDHRDDYQNKLWSIYTPSQINTAKWTVWDWIQWTAENNQGIPSIPIENVIGHEHIRNGDKTDPGPAFPWKDLYDYLKGMAVTEYSMLLDSSWNRKARVAAVQSHVRRLGVEIGGIDGVWGKNTEKGLQEAIQLFSDVYELGLDGHSADPENTLTICTALVQIPGFNRGDADHGGLSDDLRA